jgi:hypothetical protein
MGTKAKKNRRTDQVPDNEPALPLKGDIWIGADNKRWQDIAVDSASQTGIFWLRRRMVDNAYFLIVAVVHGHVLKKEITAQEAMKLHSAMTNRVLFADAFDSDQNGA